jgi:hypothetical protein
MSVLTRLHRITRQPPTAGGAGGHGNPKIHLAVNIVHLLATAGAVIETARELVEWLHLF